MESYELSTEFQPQFGGPVHAVAVFDDNHIVTGGGDRSAIIWKRAGDSKDFAAIYTSTDHAGAVKAVTVIPPCAAFPTGGFATGCADKQVRLFSFDRATNAGALVKALAGHTNAITSLGWTSEGHLISGSWDGTARVWDIASGTCGSILSGHENSVTVIGAPTGEIITGSTGRKNDANQHVDYKIRVWRRLPASSGASATGGSTPAFVVVRTIEDHEQAVRGLALLHQDEPMAGGGSGTADAPAAASGFLLVSCGNDGAVRVRPIGGGTTTGTGSGYTFVNPPLGAEGKPAFAFGVQVTPHGCIVTANEDNCARVYTLEGDIKELPLPGTAWAVAGLPNGDIVAGCGQAGTSSAGHVYVFTRDPARVATGGDLARMCYERDMIPPAPSASSGAGTGGGGSSGGGGGSGSGSIKVAGPYAARAAYPGKHDGQMGFFRQEDGSIMVTSWSEEAGTWIDIGTMEGEAGDDASGLGDGGAGGGGSATNPATGKPWDYSHGVTVDTSQGMRSMTLQWDEGDDSVAVATAFCDANGLSYDSISQISEFVLTQTQARSASSKPKTVIPQFKHFPQSLYIDLYTIDWSKVKPKLAEANAAVAAAGGVTGALALTDAELAAVDTGVIGILEQTHRYHATSVARPALRSLLAKALAWPTAHLLPVVDTLRMAVLHGDGAEALVELSAAAAPFAASSAAAASAGAAASAAAPAGPRGVFASLVAGIHTIKDAADARGVVLTAARLLFNCFRHAATRTAILTYAGATASAPAGASLVACIGELLAHAHPTVRFAGSVLAYNLATALMAHRKEEVADAAAVVKAGAPVGLGGSAAAASAATAAAVAAGRDAAAGALIATVVAAVAAGTVAEEEPCYKCVMAIGTAACMSPDLAQAAKTAGADAALAATLAAHPTAASLREAVVELRGYLGTARRA